MKHIKVQCSIMTAQKGFQFSFLVTFLYCLVTYVYELYTNKDIDIFLMCDVSEQYAGSSYAPFWSVFSVIFPFLVVLPFSFSYITDETLQNSPYLLRRMGRKSYFFGKLITAFLGGFCIIFLPFFINLVLCVLTFPNNFHLNEGIYNQTAYWEQVLGSGIFVNTPYKAMPFWQIYRISPILYDGLYVILLSAFAGLFSMFSCACSFFIKNKILLFLPVYLLFFVFRLLDIISYHSNRYINYNLISYVSAKDFYGYSPFFIMGLSICICLFCYGAWWYMSKKQGI